MAALLNMLLTFAVAALLWCCFRQWRYYLIYWKLGGPFPLPIIGVWGFLRSNNILQIIEQLNRDYKQSPLALWAGPTLFVYINDPVHSKRVITSQVCVDKSVSSRFIAESMNDGLITSANPTWAVHRKLLNPSMSLKNILNFIPIFNTEASNLCDRFADFADNNKSVEIFDILKRCFLDISCQTTLGKRLGILHNPSNEIIDHFNTMITGVAKKMSNPLYQLNFLTKVIDNKFYAEQIKSENHVKQFIKECTADMLPGKDQNSICSQNNNETTGERESLKPKQVTFLGHVIDLVQRNLFSWHDVISETNHMIVASYDTTSSALHHIITLLAINVTWQDKLYEEIKAVIPEEDSEVHYEHVQNVPLVDMIINESLRLLPVIPLLGKKTSEDFRINDDIVLPKDTNLIVDVYSLHRSSKYWGPTALEFNPYNFLPDSVANRDPFLFTPFSKGTRTCIGSRYAILNLKVFMMKLFRKYRITTSVEMQDLELMFTVVSKLRNKPKFEIRIRID